MQQEDGAHQTPETPSRHGHSPEVDDRQIVTFFDGDRNSGDDARRRTPSAGMFGFVSRVKSEHPRPARRRYTRWRCLTGDSDVQHKMWFPTLTVLAALAVVSTLSAGQGLRPPADRPRRNGPAPDRRHPMPQPRGRPSAG